MWCAARALAARTPTSSVLASPSSPPLAPTSVTASSRIISELSSWAVVPTACTSPVRSVVRQFTRRSRSPGWNGRIEKNSDPSPARRDLFCPIRPTGCGVSSEVNARVSGRATSVTSGSRFGPQR